MNSNSFLVLQTFQILSVHINTLQVTACVASCFPCNPRDCQDAQYLGISDSGVYRVVPDKTFIGVDVHCDMKTSGGGWLVIQRRIDASVDFFRGWDDYERGFGDVTGNLWLGNAAIHTITSQGFYELRVELEDWEGNKSYAEYKTFKVASIDEMFRISVSGYTGDAGDALQFHNGQVFSTKDREVSNTSFGEECAKRYTGAWWYNECHHANLNGQYLNGTLDEGNRAMGISWKQWKGFSYSLKKVEMKIRRT